MAGGAMGWTPAEVRACSLSDFAAAFEGWQATKATKKPVDMGPEALARLNAIVEEERVNSWRRQWRSLLGGNGDHRPDEGSDPAEQGPA